MTQFSRKYILFFCGFLLSFMMLTLSGCSAQIETPPVVDGYIDLSSWDFDRDGPVRLFGTWQFSWYNSDKESDTSIEGFFPVPGLWNGGAVQGQALGSKGHATYTLRLRMPDANPGKMAVLVAGGMSVSEVWINGTKMESSGRFGTSESTEEPRDHYVIAECPEAWRLMEITLRVSNYHNTQGGLNGDVLLGTAHQVNGFYNASQLLGACMAGALFCLSLLYVSLFFMRRSGKENIYFGLFCFFWCAAILFSPSSGFLMTVLAPSISWEWYINFSMLPYGATIPLMLFFYHSLFPKRFGTIIERVYLIFGLLYMVYILLTPPNAYDPLLFFYFVISGIVLIYMFVCFGIDLYHREKGVGILVAGYLALGVAELDDILFDLNIIDVASLRPLGIFVFILSYAFYMAFRFSNAFNRTEYLTRELEETNARLMQFDSLKDEFLANTTHELKTPLAGMIGIAESMLAKTDGSNSDTASAHLKTIVHSGQRLSKLINDVLDFSRLKHKDIDLKMVPVSLHDEVQRVLALGGALKRSDDVVLHNDVPPDLPPVLADPDRLEQILFNLIGNSVKFTDAGRIAVVAESRGEDVLISVTDTGRGISPESIERIVTPYEQGEGCYSGGTGIGLSITQKLVEMHGSSLEVVSEEGRGSAFSFALSRAREEVLYAKVSSEFDSGAYTLPASLPLEIEAEPGRYDVLVVDDEPVNLQVVASILDLAGISFRTAASGRTALNMIEDGDVPQMVLLDVMMPEMNGYQVCRELRRNCTPSALPIVMLTVKNRARDIVEGFAAGANDYLTKPFSREELGARVLSQLKLKGAYAALAENVDLKHEIEMRRKTESHLRLLHARLGKIFDTLDDVILVVNQSGEIVFYNAFFKQFSGFSDDELLGLPFRKLLQDETSESSTEIVRYCQGSHVAAGQSLLVDDVAVRGGDTTLGVSFWANRIELEEETLTLLVLRQGDEKRNGQQPLSAQLIQELNVNRQRILTLENVMLSAESPDPEKRQQMADELRSLDSMLNEINSRIQGQSKDELKRSVAVKVMNLSIDCWVDETRMTKADLAEQSGLWNVYMERDGYFRTQTLDKYLDLETLPQKPRWKMVFTTAEYVLANCKTDSRIQRELKKTLAELRGFATR